MSGNVNTNSPEFTSKADKQLDALLEIKEQLETINKDQKHIGGFVGENVHAIRQWVIFFGMLTIASIIVSIIVLVIFFF